MNNLMFFSRIDKLESDMKAHESEGKKTTTKLFHFRRHLANLLSDDLNTVADDEEMILQHVREMQIANRKLSSVRGMFHTQVTMQNVKFTLCMIGLVGLKMRPLTLC